MLTRQPEAALIDATVAARAGLVRNRPADRLLGFAADAHAGNSPDD